MNWQDKIKTVSEILSIIGSRPHKQKVVMCHGMFDLVHPGHIRHLSYAKSKADILIVSVTADIHAKKSIYRPFVPQDLRAMNLAALEMIDYVFIEELPSPIYSLNLLRPDIYARGYEFKSTDELLETEIDAVIQYGGEVLFTPGDVVYSSSELIEKSPPNISLDKLLVLMKSENVGFGELYTVLETMHRSKVHIIGDTIVDALTHTSLLGGMGKTPTPSVLYDRVETYLGGAAIVAAHMARAGADVTLSTILGNDENAVFVAESLRHHHVKLNSCVDPQRPTTYKNTVVCGDYRLLKIDTIDSRPISDASLLFLAQSLTQAKADAVVFSDFRHGIFNRRTIETLSYSIPITDYTIKVADSQVASRWGNILDFERFDIITPNEREARFALGDQDTGIRPLATNLYNLAKCQLLILKLGNRGVLTCRSGSGSPGSFFTVDSFANKIIDPVGAGDALLAYATLARCVSSSAVVATILGSVAAALECEVEGNQPITRDMMKERISFIEKQAGVRV